LRCSSGRDAYVPLANKENIMASSDLHVRLQEYRNARNFSQEQLAQQVLVSRAAYAQWESGLTKPSLDKIELVANVLNIDPAELAFGSQR
jgi:transcriptional regulator with XRE-family HTH domain